MNQTQNPQSGQGLSGGFAAQRAAFQPGWGGNQPGEGFDPNAAGNKEQVQRFMTRVFGWMTMGIGLTAVIAWTVFQKFIVPGDPQVIQTLSSIALPLFLVELGIVWFLSARVQKMNTGTAIGMFLFYAALNGVTLSFIFMAYSLGSIATTFFVTTMTFGFMFVYGWVTKKDLTSMGSLLFMALIGLIIASVVNMFLGSTFLYWVITYVGVLIFVGLIAYDAQKIKRMAAMGHADSDIQQKNAILGALALYLDFINLFLLMLRIFGGGRD